MIPNKPKSWSESHPDHIMATGPNRSGLRIIVPNSSFTRALNKLSELHFAIVDRKVASSSPVADKVFHQCFEIAVTVPILNRF